MTDRSQYDWDVPGHTLRMVNGSGTVNLIIGGEDTFKEMYDKGFLTGVALEDAKKKYGEKNNGQSNIPFRW